MIPIGFSLVSSMKSLGNKVFFDTVFSNQCICSLLNYKENMKY